MPELTIKQALHHLEVLAHVLESPRQVRLQNAQGGASCDISAVAIVAAFWPPALANGLLLGLLLSDRRLVNLCDQGRVRRAALDADQG